MIRLLPAVALALLLVGDGVFYAMTSPSRMFSTPPSFGSGGNPFGAEANAESSAAEGETVGNPRPDFAGADSSDFPAFDAAEGGTPPGFSGTEEGTPPGFGGSGTFPGAPASINTGAFRLMRWRFLCLPVGALLLIAEGVCILGLRRKKDSPGETITTEELDPAERRMRSERRTRRIGMGVLCGILILALVLQLVRSSMDSASSVTVNEEVRSMLSVLLDNAVRYSDENSTIGVRIMERRGRVHIEVRNACAYETVPDVRRLFDRFYRPDSSRSTHSGGEWNRSGDCKSCGGSPRRQYFRQVPGGENHDDHCDTVEWEDSRREPEGDGCHILIQAVMAAMHEQLNRTAAHPSPQVSLELSRPSRGKPPC